MTAGLAQKMVNIQGLLPGKRIAILGSGDIGLIMARRLTLEGCEVTGVYELMPYCNGLTRNVVQCLNDFDIPLHLSTTMAFIHGRDRVQKVTLAPVGADAQPRLDKAWDVACDTILMSIGLIPENELSRQLRLQMDHITGGPRVQAPLKRPCRVFSPAAMSSISTTWWTLSPRNRCGQGPLPGNCPRADAGPRTTSSSRPVTTFATACRTPSRPTGKMRCTCVACTRRRILSFASEISSKNLYAMRYLRR